MALNNKEHGSLAGMPPAFHALVPELQSIQWPQESVANCNDCVMARPHPHREVFPSETRCCTFFPRLHNFSVGRVLHRGGPGAQAVRKLLQKGASVVPMGIQPTDDWLDQYSEVGPDGFGHTLHLRCPYWVGGELACGIWEDRNQVCRTWFCKHEEGMVGQGLWEGLRDVLARAGHLLAEALVNEGNAPADGSRPEIWESWFLACAERLPRLDLDNLVEDLSLVARRKTLSQRNAGRHPPMPDVLGASLMKWQVEVDGGWMYSYSPYDEAAVPGDIWQLLSRLDGERTWQQALAETRAAGFTLGEGFIQELFRIGALESRTPGHTEPGLARVKLQEEGGKWRHLGMVEIERGH